MIVKKGNICRIKSKIHKQDILKFSSETSMNVMVAQYVQLIPADSDIMKTVTTIACISEHANVEMLTKRLHI